MALSSDLLSQFAKVTKDETKTKSDTTVYGTIVLQNGEKYVRIDGSDLLTPISSTTNVDDKERVTVMIKNHMATVTGNISSPAARGIEVDATNESVRRIEADYVKTKDLEAEYAKIENLEADYAKIKDLEADYAKIKDLEADYAKIKDLEAEYAKIKNLDTTYANIDFANIGTAAMEYFYAKSGLIKNVTVGDQTITGELIGVTIRGDRIIGNTVIADKLVIKGSDGLFYKLNTDGMNVEAEQTSENSLNGSIITAKSITATKISVSDLVAFDATIGGFKIEDTSIHSIAKTSVGNTTRGLYLGSDGQMALGDANNFLKYYKDTDGKYKLAISADSLVFSSDGKSVAEAIDGIQVGGTQLLKSSKTLPVENGNQQKWRVSSTTYVQMYDDPNSEEGFRGARIIASDATSDTQATLRSPYIALPNDWYGRQITISAWLYSPNWKNVDLGFNYYVNLCPSATEGRFRWGSKRIIEHGTGVLGTAAVANGTPKNQKWIRVSATITLNEDDISTSGSSTAEFASATHMYIGFALRRNGQVNVYAPKAEWGNKATDWSPAPEDTDEAIDSVRSEFSVTATEIRSEITDTKNGFQTQINQTKDQITLSVNDIQVGGRNLLRNTSNLKNGNYAFDASGANKQGTVTYLDDGMRITCASANVRWWLGYFPLTRGQTYAISVRYKIVSGSSPIQFQYVYMNASYTGVAYGDSAATQKIRTEDGWTVLSDSFTVPSDSAISYVRLAVRTGLDYELYTVTYDICKPKLEIGNKATDWTPAPEDTDAEFENVRSEISVTKNEIKLAVDEIRPGGTQLIKRTRRLDKDGTVDTWTNSGGVTYAEGDDGFRYAEMAATDKTADNWIWIASSVVKLPAGWKGRQVTMSAYLYSPDWTKVDNGVTFSMSISTGDKTRQRYGSVRVIAYNGGNPVFHQGAQCDMPLTNGQWLRVSRTFTLSEEELPSGTGDFDSNTHMYATYWLVRNGEVRVYAPKLEWGNKATDWSPHPEEFEAGTNVLINKDQFSVTTPEFNVNITSPDGTENMLNIDEEGIHTPAIDCPNVAPKYDGPRTLTVNSASTSAQIEAGTHYRSLNGVAQALNNKWMPGEITVNLVGDVGQSEEVTFRGIHSGYWITLKGTSSSHAKLIGKLNLYYNSAPFSIQYLDIDTTSSLLVGIEMYGRMQHARISNCIITGRGDKVGAYGINVVEGSSAKVSNCELYSLRRSFRTLDCGLLTAANCKGNCSPGTNQANMHLSGTQACSSSTTWTDHTSGGEIYKASVTIDQGSMPSPAPEATTVSYTMTNADVYAGGGWNNYSNSDIYQGYTSALGEHRGCFWFDNTTIRSALKGKTIKQVTLSLYQMSGSGRNQPVQVNLEGITVNYGASSTPYGNPEYGVIGTTLGVNQITTFTIPTKVITDLVAGTINGLMLRTGETAVMSGQDNSYHFARFAGGTTTSYRPKLTITYT